MSSRRSRRRVLAAVGSALFAGCTGLPGTGPTPTSTATPEPIRTPAGSEPPREDWTAPTDAPGGVEPNVLVENLEIPWDISVAPTGDLFVSERVGRINRFASGEIQQVLAPEDAIDAGSLEPGSDERPWWVDGGEGGTLGIAIHPDYPDAPYLFVYYTAATPEGRRNRVSRFDVGADDPADTEEVLVGGIPANNFHNGGRLTFGPGGHLWATTGDAGEKAAAADPGALNGKVLRFTVDGEPAPGNPDHGGDPRVFTYGHRNPQGIVWLPDGTVLANEHGPQARDEVNRLVAGDDYGWPDARDPEEYRAADGVHPPLVNTGPDTTWAPTGSLFYTGAGVPSWRDRVLIGGLASQQLIVLTVTPRGGDLPPAEGGRRFDADWLDGAYTATAHTALENDLGRIRHVEQGLDGEVYAVTSNRDGRAKDPFPTERDDVLVRLEPA